MPEMARWGKHIFSVSPEAIRSFSGLTLKGSCETEEKKNDDVKYAARKASKPAELSFNVTLSAYTGCSVRKEALAFVQSARRGASDFFYIAGKKLLPCPFLLTSAEISEVEFTTGGKWISAAVKLTLQQAAACDGEVEEKKPPPPPPPPLTQIGTGGRGGGGEGLPRTKMVLMVK